MFTEGPPLDTLTRRLAETPADLFLDPRIGATGRVHTDAVVADLFLLHRLEPPAEAAASLDTATPSANRNDHAVALLLCRLLSDESLQRAGESADELWRLFAGKGFELAAAGPAERFVSEPERREELVRVTLAWLGLRPAGESPDEARERLGRVHGAERGQVLVEECRAREVRAALARAAAREAADKWMRE